MDPNGDIIYRGYTLNAAAGPTVTGGGANATGITGCVVDSVDFTDVDVVQWTEKRSQADGNDAGEVELGARRIRMSGTLYALSRGLLFDALWDLRKALNPVLAQREEPADHGYRPLYFSVPTNRTEDYVSGAIELQVKALPRALQHIMRDDELGGSDADPLAISWNATFVCRDPAILSASPVDDTFATQGFVSTATGEAATNLILSASHGLAAGDIIYFTQLTGGTGLSVGKYYVLADGLAAGWFKVSTTLGGSQADILTDYSSVHYLAPLTKSGNVVNRGTYLAPVDMLFEIGATAGTIIGTIGDSTFTITVPTSAAARTIRFKGADKVLTVEENSVEVVRLDLLTFSGSTTWPLISEGTSAYSFIVNGCGLTTGSHFWFYEQYA